MPPMILIFAPCKYAFTTGGPPVNNNSRLLPINACNDNEPPGIKIISNCKFCFLNIPASWPRNNGMVPP